MPAFVDTNVLLYATSTAADNALPAARELPRLHVSFHDVNAVLLIEGNPRDLIEADDVVLADKAALAVGHVDEHARDRGLAAGNEVGVGRDLLEEMALTGAARTELDEVVVPLHERNHAQRGGILGAGAEGGWL